MIRIFFSVFLIVLCSLVSQADEFPPMFPFVVDYTLEKEGAEDVSSFLHTPAGKYGFIRVKGDQFIHDEGEIRFFGTNILNWCVAPPNEWADKHADRLAMLGINCVRIFIDCQTLFVEGYWKGHEYSKVPTLRQYHPKSLDRMDYFVSALKKRGIYIRFVLHGSRKLDDLDGFPHPKQRPASDKGLDNFYPDIIEANKELAREMLTHVNPYTGLAYVDDPAVALLEINNENSLLHEWANGKLDDLPEPYGPEFQKQWNDWLKAKYKTSRAMFNAWNYRNIPLGPEMIQGGNFTTPIPFNRGNWITQLDDARHADCRIIPERKVLRMTVHRDGKADWTPQVYYKNLKIRKDQLYTLSFRIRCDKEGKLLAILRMDTPPHGELGLRSGFDVSKEWQNYTFQFFGTADCPNGRFVFERMKQGTYEIADLSLRPGGNLEFEEKGSLEDGTVPLARNRKHYRSKLFKKDFWRFLYETERKYWTEMRDYLRDELKSQVPVCGTQQWFTAKTVQGELDFVDMHGYWCHPESFLAEGMGSDSITRNRAIVNWADTPCTLSKTALYRVAGKPYTVSEYNHPFPNRFGAEGLPMFCAYARFQGWNEVSQHAYLASLNSYGPQKILGNFDMVSHPGQLVHLPACSAMVLRGDVTGAKKTIIHIFNPENEIDALLHKSWPDLGWSHIRAGDPRIALLHAFALDTKRKTGSQRLPVIPKDQTVFVSDTKELMWDVGSGMPEQRNAGYFTLNTPKTKVFTGFIRGRTFQIGEIELSFGKTRLDWTTITVTETKPGRLLVAATGLIENSEMKHEPPDMTDPKKADLLVTSNKNWGKEPVMCEGIPVTLTLPVASAECYALDTSGKRTTKIESRTIGRKSEITLRPEYQTLWYEVTTSAMEGR